ncbi:MAG: CoA transferase [Chloroflexota bacterium]|nr:CoA transferase [Dehalococcoidia bacterium]MDW8046634.1 CoA transferase [Chloroflexota bacterium]
MSPSALDGVRVIEFCDEIGSYCGKLLADLGADVIKVEPPGGGWQRHTPPYFRDQEGVDTSLWFWVHNTSKRSVVLDLETDEGRALARKLALTADVLLEDFPPGYLAARGLGYEELHAAKPSLVYTSITGFGQFGPHAHYAYSDIVGQAMGGVMTLAGEPDDPPNMIVGNQANICASIDAAQGTLLALLYAERTGKGQHVDVSAQEAISMAQETAMQTWDLQKRNRVRTGEKGMIPVALPGWGVYRAKDGWVQLMVLAPAGKDFPALVDWMRERGMAADLDEEPYASLCAQLSMPFVTQVMTNPESAMAVIPQLAHINEVVKAFIATLGAVEAYEEGQRRQLLVGLVSTPKHLAENAQLRARGWYRPVEFPHLGVTIEFPGPPYRLSETPARIGRPPRLGEHTAEVLAELR